MKKKQSISILIVACLFYSFAINAQVSIGDQPFPHSRAILDLSNSNNLGLLLPRTASNPNSAFSTDTSGLLFYYNENLFLKGADTTFNAITPWKSIFKNPEPINVFFNPTGFEGVGIGVDGWLPGDPPASNIKANLHIGLKSKDVKTTNTSASLLIGDSDSGVHMSMDNDEILVKNSANNNTGTLKLQEGGGTVQVGESPSTPSTLNVYGAVQQNGFDLVPSKSVIMWYGTLSGVNPVIGGVANTNWRLCDGFGGTPDLRNKFVVGAGSSYNGNPGSNSEGGSASSPHKHDVNPVSFTTAGTEGAHAHSGTTGGPSSKYRACGCPAGSQNTASGGHSHSFSTGGTQGAHVHNIDVPNTESTGASNTENRPPFFALYYIMKL
ncbi:hypothetical protein OAN33_05805 [Flavobacteriales bacterium]|nr:hypothetical protein [Flavobacteriales bacterium]